MKIICFRIEVNPRKWTSVVVALALLGCFNHAFAVTYGELNQQRSAIGLPLLTGNGQVDFQMLVKECNRGIKYSCFLAQQLQGEPQQQRSSPTIPFDLNNPLEGLPKLNPSQLEDSSEVNGASPQPFDLRDPLEGLPLLGTKSQQCAQLAGRISNMKQRTADLVRQSELAQSEMDSVCRGKSQVNCAIATGKASGSAQASSREGEFYAQRINELAKQYYQMGCGQ
ncbi:hypothetical protein [Plasticicumulans lactativorans]|uniref:hypothetical protein n=1 Tax=Plasticicumulans lactativorans TaxID=1133106 RepID=UPI00104A8897|nr:hypothetical protein [Plasticicumulans lactativorans]